MGCLLAGVVRAGDVIGLAGPLGAGKTTLARALIQELGEDGEVPSPSFALIQPYDLPVLGCPLTHVDLYRIEEGDDLTELGLEEWRTDGVLLIEWPERLGPTLFADRLTLTLTPAGEGLRRLTATVSPAWEGRWSPP